MKWIVLAARGLHYDAFGPIFADTALQACDDLARGNARYDSQGRGRYFAVPLDTWQDGAFNFTAERGAEAAFSGS